MQEMVPNTPPRQFHRSCSQYQPAYLQDPLSQEQFPQDTSRMAFKAPAQPLYDDMSLYQLQQPTAAEIVSKQVYFPQPSSTEDNRRVPELEIMSQQYSTALYQQSLQYNYTTDLEHFIFTSSDSDTVSEKVAETESINQMQQEIYSYDYVYS